MLDRLPLWQGVSHFCHLTRGQPIAYNGQTTDLCASIRKFSGFAIEFDRLF